MIDKLKKIRIEKGISQKKIADMCSMTQAAISKMEINEKCNLSTAIKYADCVGYDVVLRERITELK